MDSNYTYSSRVWQVDADKLFDDFDFITVSPNNMIHRSRFLMLHLHRPHSVHTLVSLFRPKLFNHHLRRSYSPLSDHPVPLREQLKVIQTIENFANSMLADPRNARRQAIQIGVSFVIKQRRVERESIVSKSAIEGLEKVRIEAWSLEQEECVICFDNFKFKEEIRRTPCHHHFHGDCISKWIGTSNTCPICRSILLVN